MEANAKLANEISRLILSKENDFDKIKREVKIFDTLLEDTCRNFYEVKMDKDAPLFELCEVLELGKVNYCMDNEEYEERISELIESVNNMFAVNLIRSEIK